MCSGSYTGASEQIPSSVGFSQKPHDDLLWAVNKQVEPHNHPPLSFLALISIEAGENRGKGFCLQTKAAHIPKTSPRSTGTFP